jgi:hypothetical protein
MVEGPKIVSQPGDNLSPTPLVPDKPMVDESNEVPATDSELDIASYKGIVQETLDTYIEKVLDFSQLPKTQENLDKVMINLSKKLDGWLSEGSFILEDIDSRDYATHFLEEACRRRGLPNNTASWKKILKGLN